jgi:hypothetical protein
VRVREERAEFGRGEPLRMRSHRTGAILVSPAPSDEFAANRTSRHTAGEMSSGAVSPRPPDPSVAYTEGFTWALCIVQGSFSAKPWRYDSQQTNPLHPSRQNPLSPDHAAEGMRLRAPTERPGGGVANRAGSRGWCTFARGGSASTGSAPHRHPASSRARCTCSARHCAGSVCAASRHAA